MSEGHEKYEALHAQAMSHANDGFAHRVLGQHAQAAAEFREAWKLERQVAMSLLALSLEPSRSILFRSAASLALLCGETDDARRLAHLGLGGDPPLRVREVLLEVLADAEDRLRAEAGGAAESVSAELIRLLPDRDPPTPTDVTWSTAA